MKASLRFSPDDLPQPLRTNGVEPQDQLERLDRLPDPEELPRRILHIAALRGLGYSLRAIGRHYGVSPQAISVMLTRQKTKQRGTKSLDGMQQLSPRAVNVLGRLRIKNLSEARGVTDWRERLRGLRNCGQKTTTEICEWASGGSSR
jgi:hypothetical protein